MKYFKFFLSLITFTTLFVLASCNSKPKLVETGLEYTGAFVCPMHCTGSGSEAMGKCPACKMDYEPLASHKSDGHKHKKEPKTENHHHDHDGHDHGDHDGHDHGDHDGHEH